MGTPRIEIIRDISGIPRPDMDFREVPLSTMAEYLGVSTDTLWRRVRDGVIRKGVIKHKSKHFFKPRLVVGAE